MWLVFVCVSVRIGQKFLNEVPVERSILADIANYHLNSLNEKLLGPGRIICIGPYELTSTKADVKLLNFMKSICLNIKRCSL